MTFFEKLAEEVGIKEAIRLMYNECPCDRFMGLSEFCPQHGRCSSCWSDNWEGQEFKDTSEETAIYPGDIVVVETQDGLKIGRMKKADRAAAVWIDKTNIPATVDRKRVRKIVNAYLITDDLIGGTGDEVEEGMKDACKI